MSDIDGPATTEWGKKMIARVDELEQHIGQLNQKLIFQKKCVCEFLEVIALEDWTTEDCHLARDFGLDKKSLAGE